jgi:Leu/Phe-tRNA-protein transferase
VFDVQFVTDHLASLGAYEVSRSDYLAQVADATRATVEPSHVASALEGWATRF